MQTRATLTCKTQCNCDIGGTISQALKRPVQCAERFQEHKRHVSLQFARSTHRILREGSSSKIKTRMSLQRRAFQNPEMHVLLRVAAQKCMKHVSDVRDTRDTSKSSFYHSFVASAGEKLAFHHSFERPTSTK